MVNSTNVPHSSAPPSFNGLTQEQLSQLSQMIQAQAQQSVQVALNNSQTIAAEQMMNEAYAGSARMKHLWQVEQPDSGKTRNISNSVWIVDTGANCHITNSLACFRIVKLIDN